MGWLEALRIRFRSTPSLIRQPFIDRSGCDINFSSVPEDSLILDVDELATQDELIKSITSGLKICDIVIFSAVNGKGIIDAVNHLP